MKDPIILLHGWGTNVSGKKYAILKKLLEEAGFAVFAPDLPGFGSEPLLKSALTLDDYVAFVIRFMDQKKIKKAVIVGHSFGGRVAAKLAFSYPHRVSKLVFIAAPLVREPLSFKKRIVRAVAFVGKRSLFFLPAGLQDFPRRLLYRSIGEWDYYKAGNLRETLQNIIHEDISFLLTHIKHPALIVWGENDTFVPISTAEKISRLLPRNIVRIISSGTHRVPYEKPQAVADVIRSFLA